MAGEESMETTIIVEGLSAVRWDEDAKIYLSWAPGLNIYSQGATEESAFKALKGAVGLYVRRCDEKGILEEVMEKAGFKRVSLDDPREAGFRVVVKRQTLDRAPRPYDNFMALVSRAGQRAELAA
jgi:predicted RNase H-like HicB family nuclease